MTMPILGYDAIRSHVPEPSNTHLAAPDRGAGGAAGQPSGDAGGDEALRVLGPGGGVNGRFVRLRGFSSQPAQYVRPLEDKLSSWP